MRRHHGSDGSVDERDTRKPGPFRGSDAAGEWMKSAEARKWVEEHEHAAAR